MTASSSSKKQTSNDNSFFNNIPFSFILNIIISQIFFAAVQNFVELLKILVTKIMMKVSNNGFEIMFYYQDILKPIFMFIIFFIIGVLMSLGFYMYKRKHNDKTSNN